MTSDCRQEKRPAWKAPNGDGEVLLEPPLDEVGQVVASNRLLEWPVADRLVGISPLELKETARRELVEAACDHSRQYRDVPASLDPDLPLIVSGHQPELVHPGVWFKHFVLHAVAQRCGGIGVHLSIDNDTAKRTSILVPTGTPDRPALTTVAYDRRTATVPYEERRVIDGSAWSTFGERVSQAIESLVPEPLIAEFWPRVLDQSTSKVGEALASARHQLEGEWGLETLETPISRVCRGKAFAWFVAMMLADFEGLGKAYNRALADYRRTHRLKSARHPAPDLEHDDEASELPLWVWSASEPIRRRCYVSRSADSLVLTDRRGWEHRLSHRGKAATSQLAEAIAELEGRGIRLRPRALTTTLFTRWVAADLFIHGIGGAAYDEVTDRIARYWWGAEAPCLMVATGTFYLPVPVPEVLPEDLRATKQRLRDLEFHPELFVSPTSEEARRWIEQKREWIARELPRGSRRERHAKITEANARLQPWVEDLRRETLERLEQLRDAWRRRQILASREYAFCLFPCELMAKLAQAAQIDRPVLEERCRGIVERPPCR